MTTRRQTLRDSYFSWLYKQVDKGQPGYMKLCKELDRKIFRWSVHNDDNRCEDGLALRQQYADDNRLDERHLEVRYFIAAKCTVFEMLVALAQRMNDLTYDLKNQENKAPKWFTLLLHNLKVSHFTDKQYPEDRLPEMVATEVDDILEVFMDRTYAYDGTGGLFPLKRRPREDQTEVEIYYQLMLWLDENYGQ